MTSDASFRDWAAVQFIAWLADPTVPVAERLAWGAPILIGIGLFAAFAFLTVRAVIRAWLREMPALFHDLSDGVRDARTSDREYERLRRHCSDSRTAAAALLEAPGTRTPEVGPSRRATTDAATGGGRWKWRAAVLVVCVPMLPIGFTLITLSPREHAYARRLRAEGRHVTGYITGMKYNMYRTARGNKGGYYSTTVAMGIDGKKYDISGPSYRYSPYTGDPVDVVYVAGRPADAVPASEIAGLEGYGSLTGGALIAAVALLLLIGAWTTIGG